MTDKEFRVAVLKILEDIFNRRMGDGHNKLRALQHRLAPTDPIESHLRDVEHDLKLGRTPRNMGCDSAGWPDVVGERDR